MPGWAQRAAIPWPPVLGRLGPCAGDGDVVCPAGLCQDAKCNCLVALVWCHGCLQQPTDSLLLMPAVLTTQHPGVGVLKA